MPVRTVKKYNRFDIVNVFLMMGFNENISRYAIANELELGEGSTKGILSSLSAKKLIRTTKQGSSLTQSGKKLLNDISSILGPITEINSDVFRDNMQAYGAVLRSYEKSRIEDIYKARDFAIRNRCQSSMILYCGKDITIPNLDRYKFNSLREELELDLGNLIILTSSQSKRVSSHGILAVTEYLNTGLRKMFGVLA